MREIKVVITREWHCHGMTMQQAVAHCLAELANEPSRVTITAHDVFDKEQDDAHDV